MKKITSKHDMAGCYRMSGCYVIVSWIVQAPRTCSEQQQTITTTTGWDEQEGSKKERQRWGKRERERSENGTCLEGEVVIYFKVYSLHRGNIWRGCFNWLQHTHTKKRKWTVEKHHPTSSFHSTHAFVSLAVCVCVCRCFMI